MPTEDEVTLVIRCTGTRSDIEFARIKLVAVVEEQAEEFNDGPNTDEEIVVEWEWEET